MLKQIEESTQTVIDLTSNELLFAKDMGNGITLATLRNTDGNVETCTTNLTTLWKALLDSPEFT